MNYNIYDYTITITIVIVLHVISVETVIPQLGEKCFLNRCLGEHVKCNKSENICRCTASHPVPVSQHCYPQLALRSKCVHTDQCRYSDRNSFCSHIDYNCKCKEGFYEDLGRSMKCIPDSRPIATPDMKMFLVVMVVGLLIVSVFVYFGITKFCERLRTVNGPHVQVVPSREAAYSDNEANPPIDSLPPSYTQAVVSPLANDDGSLHIDDVPPPSYEDAIKDNKDIPPAI